MSEAATELLLGRLRDGLEEREGHLVADDGGGLEQSFVLGREPVDPGRQHRLGGRRDLQAVPEIVGRRQQPVGAALAGQDLRLDQRPDALLEEEGVPLGPLDQQSLERLEGRIGPEQDVQQLLGALRWQGIDPELAVVALAAPGVLVLGAVVDEEQQPGGREALDQAVQERLRLGSRSSAGPRTRAAAAGPGSRGAAGA